MTAPARAAPHRPARVWIAVVTTVVLVAAIGAVIGFTGLFGVRTVAVTGVRSLSAADVAAAAAVRRGEPLIRVDVDAVAARVRTIPGVARVAVHRSWPATLRIAVTERRAVAVVRRDGGDWLVDGGGVVFQKLTGRPPARLPRLDLAAVGPADRRTRAALAALAALTRPVAAQVRAVAAPTEESVTLTLRGDRTVVWGGAADGAAKARALGALLRQPGTRYDVSSPPVVTVR